MKKFMVVIAVVAVAVTGWRWHAASQVIQKDGGALVANRFWIDHVPSSERDQVEIFALIGKEKIGVFEKRSRWVGQMELYRYQLSGEQLRAEFPQTGAKEAFTVSAKACTERGFDYCLEVSGGSHGVHRYFSKKNWIIRSVADEQALLATL